MVRALWSVWTPGSLVTHRPGDAAPAELEEAAPGVYEVILTAAPGKVYRTKVEIRPDRQVVLTFDRAAARSADNAEEFALVTGKTFMYIGVGIFYVFYAWCSACLDDPLGLDDEDRLDVQIEVCSSCGKSNCSHPRAEKPKSPPKVKDILKPEKKP